ncbi:MAG: ABC transporter substrate-binding protein [Chloroflexi bacterium]|nr:ABC transporter substrate-binding protein [Chloroflexota bacterium]
MKLAHPDKGILFIERMMVPAILLVTAVGCIPLTATSPAAIPTKTNTPPTPPSEILDSAHHLIFVEAREKVEIDTLDPALAYDAASSEIIQNVYETLVFYDGTKADEFVPQLAESWSLSEDGTVYTFHIRQGVKFHAGGDLTPSDVAYSFQRGLLQGGYSSPQWLLAEPFFGRGIDDISLVVDGEGNCADDRYCMIDLPAQTLKTACEKVQAAIVADDAAGTVTMTLAQPWAPFLANLAQPWGSIMDREWVIENGGWDGSCDTWQNFYGMVSKENPFSAIANGTGPFVLDELVQGDRVSLDWNTNYWRKMPRIMGVFLWEVPDWEIRKAMMQGGDADRAEVPSEGYSEMKKLVGERCEFDLYTNGYDCKVIDDFQPLRVYLGQPAASQDVLLFNWDIKTHEEDPNPYIGSGALDGNGIPPDFFSDVHIRKGFAYAFDWDTFITTAFDGEAIQSRQLPLPGMNGFFSYAQHYEYNLEKSAREFKLADLDKDGIPAGQDPEGDVWTTGFRFQIMHIQGNRQRSIIGESLSINLFEVNELFVIESLGRPWDAYLRSNRVRPIPIMTAGWLEDIHDPHHWFEPYTQGSYASRQVLPEDIQAQFKEILERGLAETDPVKRAQIYKEATNLYYNQCIGLPLVIPTRHFYMQRWVQGLIPNPAYQGTYFYTIYAE